MQIGLIGAGSGARLRADCYERLPEVTVSGIVGNGDRTLDRAASTVYPDVETLLEEDGIDAVDVRSPEQSQSAIVDQCLDAGVAVVCRTPLADGIEDAESICEAADRSEAPVLVDAHHRFARENSDAKSLISEGEIGTLTTVRTTRRVPAANERQSVSTENRLLERALYPDVARLRWVLGDVERVFARLRSGDDSNAGHALVIARLASGAVAHLEVSRGNRHDIVTVEVEYSGTDGRLTYDSEASRALDVRSRDRIETGVGAGVERPRPSSDLHDRHVERLVACLRDEADPVELLPTAVETLRTVRAAVESVRRGVPVDVEEVTA